MLSTTHVVCLMEKYSLQMQVSAYMCKQVTTYMNPTLLKKSETPATRERLLAAAMRVFARDGLHKATTPRHCG